MQTPWDEGGGAEARNIRSPSPQLLCEKGIFLKKSITSSSWVGSEVVERAMGPQIKPSIKGLDGWGWGGDGRMKESMKGTSPGKLINLAWFRNIFYSIPFLSSIPPGQGRLYINL